MNHRSRLALRAMGVLGEQAHAPHHSAAQTRTPSGRFAHPGHSLGVTLNGGPVAPPPPARRTPDQAVRDHDRFLAELIGPDLGA